ncbi:hypothetical protein H4Q26_003387, partial [Puccinia striiformis f. sp. tritici PST-130]
MKKQGKAAPQSVAITPEPLSDEEEAPDEELIKTLVKKHIKIYKTYLATSLKNDMKILLDQAQQSQKILHKLIGNSEVESYVKEQEQEQEASLNSILERTVQSPVQKTPRIERRPQRPGEMEATRSSDDDSRAHASPHHH